MSNISNELYYCPECAPEDFSKDYLNLPPDKKTVFVKDHRSEFLYICSECGCDFDKSELTCECCEKDDVQLKDNACKDCYDPTPYEIEY